MEISGWQKLSLMDYPGKLATVIFTQGCNFRCPYCHNKQLIAFSKGILSEREIISFLEKNKQFLDGIVLTGGEPILQKDILSFLTKIKEMNLLVKLDTNGTSPEKLKELIFNKLVDYIAMDLKSDMSVEGYSQTLRQQIPEAVINNIKESVGLIITSGLPHEFRTTLAKELNSLEAIKRLLPLVEHCQTYYLQAVVSNQFTPFSQEEIAGFIANNSQFSFLQSRN